MSVEVQQAPRHLLDMGYDALSRYLDRQRPWQVRLYLPGSIYSWGFLTETSARLFASFLPGGSLEGASEAHQSAHSAPGTTISLPVRGEGHLETIVAPRAPGSLQRRAHQKCHPRRTSR